MDKLYFSVKGRESVFVLYFGENSMDEEDEEIAHSLSYGLSNLWVANYSSLRKINDLQDRRILA
jgi:hypothetical protein